MDTARSLPAREPALPGESLASLLRRTAASMGYKGPGQIRQLLSTVRKVPWNINHIGPGLLIDYLAVLLRTQPDDILASTVHRFAERLVLHAHSTTSSDMCDFKTTLRYFTPKPAVCPTCLRKDAIPYERLTWSLRPLGFCTQHHCLLVTKCPDCGRVLWQDRSDVRRCHCGADLRGVARSSLPGGARCLASLLNDLFCSPKPSVLEMVPPNCVWWAERLATAAAKTPAWIQGFQEPLALPKELPVQVIAWLAVADILRHWPQRFEQFLDVFQCVAKHRTTSTGLSRRFGLLIREAHDLEQRGYPVPADALRSYLLRHYTLGHLSGKVCLFQSARHQALLRHRHWISQTEAARLLRLRTTTIAELIHRGVLKGHVHPTGDCGRHMGLVSRASADTLKRELADALSILDVATRLGLGRSGVLALIHEGVLPRAVRTIRGWRIPRQSTAALDRVCRDAPPLKRPGQNWITLREATRRYGPTGLSLSALLRLMLNEEVGVRMVKQECGLHGLVVHRAKLESLLPNVRLDRDRAAGLPVSRAAKVILPGRSLKPAVLQKWIAAGLLQSCQVGRACIVTHDEMQRFRDTYCLRDEARRILQVSRTTLARWEEQGHIRPVYSRRSHFDAGASVFRREDVKNTCPPRRRCA